MDKFEYYHGAAVIRLLENEKCKAVKKRGLLGYVVNESIFVFVKYTTKARTPWGFTFDQEDVYRCCKMAEEYDKLYVALVCGGDGVCALKWREAERLLDGKPGRISAGRRHNESYAVKGSEEKLKGKVSVNRWPRLLFE